MKLPGAKERVALVVPGTGRLLGRIEEVGDGFLKLDAGKGGKGLVSKGSREDVTLLFSATSGIGELKGALRREGLMSNTLRFDFELPKREIQRRKHVRVDAQLPIMLRLNRPDAKIVKSQTVNVSGGGLEIVDVIGLPIRGIVKIELRLPGEALPVPLTGRIVRQARPNTKGVQIERMLASDQSRLVKFIFDRQRLEIRAQRTG